jgi:sterol desaturase/sphingolipid hydroxylase (fatty acid hydroxylase superfamily)
MIEYLIYNTIFFGVYICVGSWICEQENYNTSDTRFLREFESGSRGLMKQLLVSNVITSNLIPYTQMSSTFSLYACLQYLVFFDFLQFLVHYMLHMDKDVYKKIHMDHHKTVYVNPFSATRMTLSEVMVTGIIPTVVPLFSINIDFVGWTIMNVFFFIHGLFIHSTYKLPYEPFLLGSQNHAAHHMKKTVNFGFLLPIWDEIAKSGMYQIPRDHIRQRIHRYYDNKGKHH